VSVRAKLSKGEVNAWLRFLGEGSDNPRAGELLATLAPERAPRQRRSAVLESDVQRTILAYLRRLPSVATCERYNSGSFGNKSQYRFNSADGHSDLAGHRKDGRAFFVEVKRSERDVLSFAQAQFLVDRWSSALVGVARSIEDARAIVDGKYSIHLLLDEVRRVPVKYLSVRSREIVQDPAELVARLEAMR
jgi:hypothetical protein